MSTKNDLEQAEATHLGGEASEAKGYAQQIEDVLNEIAKIVVGQREMLEGLLIGLFTGGHVLLEGVPGLAKTLSVHTLAQTLGLRFQRIQFTPDLLPADLIGTMIYNAQERSFEVKKGPIFAQIILADEINRAAAKVQSALLEAMQERQVTIGERTYPLERPFLVLATQNPLEQEGTYPLPEAQVDRFMMRLFLDYPTQEEEIMIMQRMGDLSFEASISKLLDTKQIHAIRSAINKVQLSEGLLRYIAALISATRRPEAYDMPEMKSLIQFGSSPRGSIQLHIAARAHAFMRGRDYVLPEDIKAMAPRVLNHRIILNYEAEAEGITTATFIDELLKKIPIQKYT